MRIAQAILASVASPVSRMIPMTSLAKIAARRGEGDVWPHLDAAMTAADGTTQAEYIGPVRLARAEARRLESDLAAARQEAELADDAFADATHPWLNGEIAVWLRRTGSPRTAATSPRGKSPSCSRPRSGRRSGRYVNGRPHLDVTDWWPLPPRAGRGREGRPDPGLFEETEKLGVYLVGVRPA